jgi:hypothetical protein
MDSHGKRTEDGKGRREERKGKARAGCGGR